MRIFLIFYFCLEFISAQSFDGRTRNQFYVRTDFEAGSSVLSSRFLIQYLRGGFISNDVKNAFFNKLDHSNTIGAIWDTEIGFKKYLKYKSELNGTFQAIGVENFNIYEARFAKDLFGLYFYGNKPYENKLVDLSNMRFSQLKFQILKIGHYQRLGIFGLGCNAGLVLGQNFIDISTGNSSLYTAPYGEFIDFNLKLNSLSSNLNKDKLFSIEGTGFSLDLKLDVYATKNVVFGLGIDRLGFVKFRNENVAHKVDSTFRFEGIKVESILDSFVLDVKRPEEYKDELLKQEISGPTSKSLPSRYFANISYTVPGGKINLNSKVSFITNSFYRASWQSDFSIRVLRVLSLGMDAGIGGYSKWNLGLNGSVQFGKILNLSVHASSLFNLYNLNKPVSAIGGATIKINF